MSGVLFSGFKTPKQKNTFTLPQTARRAVWGHITHNKKHPHKKTQTSKTDPGMDYTTIGGSGRLPPKEVWQITRVTPRSQPCNCTDLDRLGGEYRGDSPSKMRGYKSSIRQRRIALP